jgi:RimJ/RimL family protein N-acetyltransferase
MRKRRYEGGHALRHNYSLQHKNVMLRPLARTDLEFLRNWRNDPETSRFLSPIPYIMPDSQSEWFEKESADSGSCTFAIEETERLRRIIGSVALYNIEGDTAEFGRFMLSSETRGMGIGQIAVKLILQFGYRMLSLSRITAEVHQKNNAAIITYLKSGFVIFGNYLIDQGEYMLMIMSTDISGERGGYVTLCFILHYTSPHPRRSVINCNSNGFEFVQGTVNFGR